MIIGDKEVINSPAVRNYHAVISPLLAQYLKHQPAASATWFTFISIVGTHHLSDIAFINQGLERRQVCLPQITCRYRCIVRVSVPFRSAMHSKVLCASISLKIVRIITLQPFHCGYSQAGGEEGILAVSLLSSSPAGVTKNIDIWSPEA